MNASSQDINQTLEYRTAKAIVRLLPTGLLLILLGLFIYAPHVRPIVVGVAVVAEYAVRCRKDCCDLTG